jgi:hypothetical protein
MNFGYEFTKDVPIIDTREAQQNGRKRKFIIVYAEVLKATINDMIVITTENKQTTSIEIW